MGLENRVVVSARFVGRTKSSIRVTLNDGVLVFRPIVISSGQHDIRPEGCGQSPMSAIGSDLSRSAIRAREVSTGPEFAKTGSAHPMKHASTANHRERNVATVP
jgi:hypothetical protein